MHFVYIAHESEKENKQCVDILLNFEFDDVLIISEFTLRNTSNTKVCIFLKQEMFA